MSVALSNDQRVMALCHPDRPSARGRDRACIECVCAANRERKNAKGKNYQAVDLLPRRVPGVKQKVVRRVPDKCDKCGNVFLIVEGRMVRCPGVRGGCGQDWFLVA